MSAAVRLEFPQGYLWPPWDLFMELTCSLDSHSWILVGGLMVQAHALLHGITSRATSDIDLLIDVLADTSHIELIISRLEELQFEIQIPGLRDAPFHRLRRGKDVVDVLVADHLPSGAHRRARIGRLRFFETEGGAQALERRMEVTLKGYGEERIFFMPDVLGALVMKSAAYSPSGRNSIRHLEDAALLASLIEDVDEQASRLHGSDRKHIRKAYEALSDPLHETWSLYTNNEQSRILYTLRVLAGIDRTK